MAEYSTTEIEGLRKIVYADRLENAVPEDTSIAADVPFIEGEKRLGNTYNKPVRLTRSHGWTLSTAGNAFALNDAEPCVTKEASISGVEFVIRETIAYAVLGQLKKTPKEGKARAFVDATGHVYDSMTEAANFVREIMLIYGAGSVGTVNSQTDDSGTSQTFDFTAATFIPALWSGMENGFVDVYSSGGTKRNTTGTMQVTAVDIDNRAVTFLGTEGEMDNIAATDLVYLRGMYGTSVKSFKDIFSNTGTLFGINAATYSLWKGNSYPASSGQFVFDTVLKALNKPAGRGFKGKMNAYVSTASWNDAMNNLAALRRYAEKNKASMEQGADGIKFHFHSGTLELKHHLLMMPSIALCFPPAACKRIGSTDLTFKLPGTENYFPSQLSDNAGIQVRGYWDQAPFSSRPKDGLVVTGLVNSDQ